MGNSKPHGDSGAKGKCKPQDGSHHPMPKGSENKAGTDYDNKNQPPNDPGTGWEVKDRNIMAHMQGLQQ
eukprot:7524153-Karenia_brevis.AAC.1